MSKGGYRPGAGRKKGAATLYSEALRDEIAWLVSLEAPAIIQPQIEKAKKGDTMAFNSLMAHLIKKLPQEITGADGGALQVMFDHAFKPTGHD